MGKKNRKNEGTAKPDAQQTANENQSMVAAAIAVDADMILSDSNVKKPENPASRSPFVPSRSCPRRSKPMEVLFLMP